VPALEERRALRGLEHHQTQARGQVGAALVRRQFGCQAGNWCVPPTGHWARVIAAREAADRPSPLATAAEKRAKSSMVVSIEPAARTLLRSS
jgi:hypothetical protein